MRYFNKQETDVSLNFWSSFTDLMVGLFLIFLIIFTGIVFHLVVQNKILRNIRSDLNELKELFKEDDYLTIDEKGTISIGTEFFQIDKYELSSISEEGKQKLRTIGQKFKHFLDNKKGRIDNYTLIIAGFTDTYGTPQHNFELSFNRAKTIYNFWKSEVGFSNIYDLIYTGYGENKKFLKVKSGNSLEQKENRRIEIRLVPKFKDLMGSLKNGNTRRGKEEQEKTIVEKKEKREIVK